MRLFWHRRDLRVADDVGLADFCSGDIYRYAEARDYPAEGAT